MRGVTGFNCHASLFVFCVRKKLFIEVFLSILNDYTLEIIADTLTGEIVE